jgi:hypothetical protein
MVNPWRCAWPMVFPEPQELASNSSRLCVPIRNSLSQHMPDDQKPLARDGNDGFALANPGCQALKLCFPIRVILHRHPSRNNLARCAFPVALARVLHPVWYVCPEAWTLAPSPLYPTKCLAEGKRVMSPIAESLVMLLTTAKPGNCMRYGTELAQGSCKLNR